MVKGFGLSISAGAGEVRMWSSAAACYRGSASVGPAWLLGHDIVVGPWGLGGN